MINIKKKSGIVVLNFIFSYNGNENDTRERLRYNQFMEIAATSNTTLKPQNLPPPPPIRACCLLSQPTSSFTSNTMEILNGNVYRAIIKDPLFIIYVTLVFIVLGLYMYHLDSSPILERCIMKVLSYIFSCY